MSQEEVCDKVGAHVVGEPRLLGLLEKVLG